MRISLFEHRSISIRYSEEEQSKKEEIHINDSDDFNLFRNLESKEFNTSSYKYSVLKGETEVKLVSDYCIGIDWLGDTNCFIHVEPKINASNLYRFEDLKDEEEDDTLIEGSLEATVLELDYLKMLLDVFSGNIDETYLSNLFSIDWNAKQISIEQNQDHLTPFLVVEFLQVLRKIVVKGLKKTYYKTNENLTSKVKGKILVSQQIKQNTLKGRLTKTMCQYQVFGEDNPENRFLKKVLSFAVRYVQNNKSIFHENIDIIRHLISYCQASFENIGNHIENHELKQIKPNLFFKEYSQAIKIGQYILKRFSYNISKTTDSEIKTPPFWIDMPRLFELYVYHHLIKSNKESRSKIHYQFSTYGNSLDFLIKDENHPMIIDTKYKLHYENGHLHQDIRQVSGYARLNKVRNELKIADDRNINCLIIYPSSTGIDLQESSLNINNLISSSSAITPYYKVFKLGIRLPFQDNKSTII